MGAIHCRFESEVERPHGLGRLRASPSVPRRSFGQTSGSLKKLSVFLRSQRNVAGASDMERNWPPGAASELLDDVQQATQTLERIREILRVCAEANE